jgi:hypothetical protein
MSSSYFSPSYCINMQIPIEERKEKNEKKEMNECY